MSLASALAAGRRAAEARMTSRCTIKRAAGRTTGADGMDVDTWTTLYTDLPVRISGTTRGASPTTGSDNQAVEVNRAHRNANVPVTTTGLADGDIIEITDGENTGIFFRITEADWQDQATARRLPIEATEQPEGWS